MWCIYDPTYDWFSNPFDYYHQAANYLRIVVNHNGLPVDNPNIITRVGIRPSPERIAYVRAMTERKHRERFQSR